MSRGPQITEDVLEEAAQVIRARTGLVFSDARRTTLLGGLAAAMGRSRLDRPPDYLERLRADPALLDDLVSEITVGETYFFREPRQFEAIRDEILPRLVSSQPLPRTLRIWSAGCASGEEPYTLAILLRQSRLEERAHVLGTDISRAALARASHGRYGRWSLRGVPDQVIRAYFEPRGDQFEIAAAVRRGVEFCYLNLALDTYPSLATAIWGMDLILCRNVLIYLDAETVARVAGRLLDSLSDDGWLILGSSDPPLGDLVPCDVVITDAGLAYRRPGRHAEHHRVVALAPSVSAHLPLPPPALPVPTAVPVEAAAPADEPATTPAAAGPPGSHEASDAADCYRERDYERAAELATRALQHGGSDAALWVVLVRALANRGELEAAGRACAAALDRHRTSAELAYLHAVLLGEGGRWGEAATAARRALYLDPGLVVGHLALGTVLLRLGKTTAARRAFRNAERLLAGTEPGEVVPAADGEPAARLAVMVREQLRLVTEAVA